MAKGTGCLLPTGECLERHVTRHSKFLNILSNTCIFNLVVLGQTASITAVSRNSKWFDEMKRRYRDARRRRGSDWGGGHPPADRESGEA